MKVLVINGSTHRKGCTYTALSEVMKVLNAEGIGTEVIQLGVEPIRGCIACGQCKVNHRCVFNDLVNEALIKMEQCDGLVVGSPVYYASSNGALTAFLDRLFYAGSCFAYKPAAAIVSARRAGTTASLDQLNKYFMISNMPVVSSFYWNMVHGNHPEEVLQDKEGMQIMRTLGKNMAWMLKLIEAGKNQGINIPVSEKRERTNFIR